MFYVPDFNHNLLSVGKLLLDHHLFAQFEATSCCFQDLTTRVVKAVGLKEGSLYKLTQQPSSNSSLFSCVPLKNSSSNAFQATANVISLQTIHARLGHISMTKLQHLPFLSQKQDCNNFHCEACVMAKHHKLPYPVSTSLASACFDLIHIDL